VLNPCCQFAIFFIADVRFPLSSQPKIIEMWVLLGLVSALFLGVYDIVRKTVLNGNTVIPVLFLASSTCGIIFIPFVVLSRTGIINPSDAMYVPTSTLTMHLLFLLKSIIVGASWFLGYFAIRNLPLTVVTPINSTRPAWIVLGAFFIYGERFTGLQIIGIIIVLFFFYLFSLAGKKEGIVFSKNKWVFAVIGATMLGAISSLYDKYLFTHYNRMAAQTWYSIYFIPVLLPVLLLAWYPNRKSYSPFRWSWLIPVIGITLVISDFVYFYALSLDGSMVSILSVLRRSSVVVSFIAGAIIFGEQNLKRKALALAGILAGLVLIVIGTI
jgi:bacterial/archaeal transporter family protein